MLVVQLMLLLLLHLRMMMMIASIRKMSISDQSRRCVGVIVGSRCVRLGMHGRVNGIHVVKLESGSRSFDDGSR